MARNTDRRRRRISIRGVVYLHRITDNRMGGTALRNFRMFHAICGASAMKNAIIVLNMWDRTKSDVYEPREKELRNVFFQPAMKNGASILRHDGSKASGELILSTLLERPAVDLAIQTEMVDQGMALRTTEAGLALLGDLAGRERKHAEELRRIRGELKEARLRRDVADESDLRVTEERLESLQRRMAEEQDNLQRSVSHQPHGAGPAQGIFAYLMALIVPRHGPDAIRRNLA